MTAWKEWPRNTKYEVSSNGDVRNKKSGRVLKPYIWGKGYRRYAFRVNGKNVSFAGHRIVAETFIGPPKGLHVNHKNLNPADNSIGNLEYCTPKENVHHAIANGVKFGSPGVRNGRNKYSEEEIKEVKRLLSLKTRPKDIVNKTGVSRDIVYLVSRGKIWNSLKETSSVLTRK